MPDFNQWTLRFLEYEPIDEALDDRMRRIASDADKIPAEAMQLDVAAGLLTIDCRKIPAWHDSARERLRCVRVGQRFVVKPPWLVEPVAPHERLLEIDPGGAFGSALHETTRLCLLAIERNLPAGTDVLEIGTGSGILSIAAARCGAACVRAVDIDADAVRVARANVVRNGFQDRINVRDSDGPPWLDGQVDVVIANITFDVLSQLRSAIGAVLRPRGLLIASGISARFWEEFVLGVESGGFVVQAQLHDGPWSALIASRRT